MNILPSISTDDELEAIRKNPALCKKALDQIAEQEQLFARKAVLFEKGSTLAGKLGSTVIKSLCSIQ